MEWYLLKAKSCLCEELAAWQSHRRLGFYKAKDRRAIARDDILPLSKYHSGQIAVLANILQQIN